MDLTAGFSHDRYWNEFEVRKDDLDFITNLLLEREVPLTTEEMALALIGDRLEQLAEEAAQANKSEIGVYLPAEKYKVGETLLFSAIGNKVGEVVGVRGGENPTLGKFDVINVRFKDDSIIREFAARLEDHRLNQPPETISEDGNPDSPEKILELFGDTIEERLQTKLDASAEIVQIAGKWFPKGLLADFHEGHLNLAEAVLDVAEGEPTPTVELMKHLELPKNLDPALAEFSLDYALQEDERFDEIGPAGVVLWYLKRLAPPEVLYTPPRLVYEPVPYDSSALTPQLIKLEEDLADELSSVKIDKPAEEVTISVLFPHWRVGALPLSSQLQPLFPTAYEAPRIRFILVDGHSGDTFPGWVVREQRYVFGLDEWYRKYDVPAGGLVKIRVGDLPGEVIVEALDRRRRNDWIRTISIGEGGRIGFTMLKQPVGTAYNDLMVVGLIDATVLDEAWLKGGQKDMQIDRLVAHVFRELAKLNPQSAVHAQSLYSGVNVIRRLPPGPVFAELTTRPYYLHVGDLYWRFDESAWSQA